MEKKKQKTYLGYLAKSKYNRVPLSIPKTDNVWIPIADVPFSDTAPSRVQ